MKNISNHIKNNEYKSIYLLYGEEDYLKKMYRDKLRMAIAGEGANMNLNHFEGKDTTPEEIIEISETAPFFADKRLIIIEDSGYFQAQRGKSAANGALPLEISQRETESAISAGSMSSREILLDYFGRIPDTTCMVFVEKDVDKRGKLYKRVKDKGYVCEMNHRTEDVLIKWILGKLAADNKKITKETMEFFLACTGSEMINIENEINKLLAYTMGREVITDRDVLDIVSAKISGKIFDMIDAIGTKNTKKAMDLYYDLIATRESPMKILYMLMRQFNIMIQVKELAGRGYSGKAISEKTEIHSFVVGKVMRQVDGFAPALLLEAFNDCVKTNEDIKSGRIDEMSGVEMIIIKYSGKDR